MASTSDHHMDMEAGFSADQLPGHSEATRETSGEAGTLPTPISRPTATAASRKRLVNSEYSAQPVMAFFPPHPTTGKADEEVQDFQYNDFPDVEFLDSSMPRLSHWSLRYWIKFLDPQGLPIDKDDEPDFSRSGDRIAHTENIRQKLIEQGIMLKAFAEDTTFYYGMTEPPSHDSAGEPTGLRPQPFLDVKLPAWNLKIAQKLTVPGVLQTNKTAFEFLGTDTGVGPRAPPYYALALMVAPARVQGSFTGTDAATFREFCDMAQVSFDEWTRRHDTRQTIVAWGGFFEDGDHTKRWDFRFFAIYRVPVSSELEGTNDASKLRDELQKFPPCTMLDGLMIRNKLNYRLLCTECGYKAGYIHGVTGHRCATCNQVGHLKRDCTKIRRPPAPKRKIATLATFDTHIDLDEHRRFAQEIAVDHEALEYERLAAERAAKRRRR